jgi:hypothetical protein
VLALRVAVTAVQFENRSAVLPDGNRRAEFAKALEVFLEKRPEPIGQ